MKKDAVPSLNLKFDRNDSTSCIIDEENIEMLHSPPRRGSSDILDGACSFCLTNLKNCEYYRKKCVATQTKNIQYKRVILQLKKN